MQVYGSFTQQVIIDPISVIEKLIAREIGDGSWVFKENDKYYRGFEVGYGGHTWDDSEEISEELYNYITSLKIVLNHLKENDK